MIWTDILLFTRNAKNDCYTRFFFRVLLSESTSMSESFSRFTPTEELSGTNEGLSQTFNLESSPPVNSTLFYTVWCEWEILSLSIVGLTLSSHNKDRTTPA